MAQRSNRLEAGGIVDLAAQRSFTVDGTRYQGCAGDTVASALLALGRVRVGNSIYLGRPRGILTCGVEEPNAFVRVDRRGDGSDYGESMMPATTRIGSQSPMTSARTSQPPSAP